jgi:hypothetical protein
MAGTYAADRLILTMISEAMKKTVSKRNLIAHRIKGLHECGLNICNRRSREYFFDAKREKKLSRKYGRASQPFVDPRTPKLHLTKGGAVSVDQN